MSTLFIGTLAEHEACTFLESQGLHLIKKNFLVWSPLGKKVGEIDLIMKDGGWLVFVEVKKRGRADYGSVLEMVGKEKQRRIIRTATHYLLETDQYDKVYCRFDVVGIASQKIEWIKNAFEVQY